MYMDVKIHLGKHQRLKIWLTEHEYIEFYAGKSIKKSLNQL